MTAPEPTLSKSYGRNPQAWTVVLNGVSPQSRRKDIETAITAPYDRPRHIEMGNTNYEASGPEVSVDVRSKLEEYGTLEDFFLAPVSKGKRIKAVARFQDEEEARAACSLNNKPLPILNGGRLTVTLIRSFKIKIVSAIYFVLQRTIDEKAREWKEKHLIFRVYPDVEGQFTTLKIEGDNTEAVSEAQKTLQKILDGKALTGADDLVWSPALNCNGPVFQAIKALGRELKVVIIRDKAKRRLLYYGPLEKLNLVARQVTDILQQDKLVSFEIDLSSEQFNWAVTGGFKIIQQTLGKGVSVFNIVTRRIIINGSDQHYRLALALLNQRNTVMTPSTAEATPQGDCPICFCKAENPVKTSCQHIYCLECFEENCKAAASMSGTEFKIKCQGDEGLCPSILGMEEVRAFVSSSAFESTLR